MHQFPNQAAQERAAAAAAAMLAIPGNLRQFLAAQPDYQGKDLNVLSIDYWSAARFAATRAAGPPVTLTIDTTERKAFSYAIGQAMDAAGRAGVVATLADTNLLKASETRDNADFWITGIGAYVAQGDSEPEMVGRLWREVSVQISLNGTTQIPLGTLEMFPSAGGLYGQGRSFTKEPPLATPGAVDNGQGAALMFLNNGNPMSGSYHRLDQPFKWAGVGKGGSDSSLVITCRPERQIVITCGTARVAAAGVSAFTPPAAAGDPGTFVDVRFRLFGVQVSPRSKNV